MGSTGKAAFIAIIVLGAITGYVMYSLFDLYTIPKPGIINSVDRTNLTATPSKEAGSTLGEGGTTETTTTPATGGGGGGGSTTTNATTTTTTAAAATLTIPVGASTPGNPSYDPLSLTVKKGDAIDVVNKDSSPHTVTSGKTPDAPDAGKQFDTSIVNAGQSAKLETTNLQAGQYDFHCAVHPFMMGKIIVQ